VEEDAQGTAVNWVKAELFKTQKRLWMKDAITAMCVLYKKSLADGYLI